MSDEIVSDVVVVGGGGAGLAAAIEASSAGASVQLLEKAPSLKGSTGWSVGSITATGTPEQKRLGVVDSPQEHKEDYAKFAGSYADRENWHLVDILVENVADTVEWLKGFGLHFAGPFPEPPHRKPRLLVVLPNSMAYIRQLSRHATKKGVSIRLETRAQELIVEEGRVVGVVADSNGTRAVFKARCGVILAGGDFSNSYELKKRFHSVEYASFPALNVWNTGDAIEMAEAVGGSTVNADVLFPPNLRFMPRSGQPLLAFIPPWPLLTKLIGLAWRLLPASIVRPLALRLSATAMSPDASIFDSNAAVIEVTGKVLSVAEGPIGTQIAKHAPEGAYILLHGSLIEKFSRWPHFVSTAPGLGYAYLQDFKRSRSDIYHEDASLAGLADKLGLNPAVVEKAVSQAGWGTRISVSGPYAALGPVKAMTVITDGGLKISEKMQVLTAEGSPVPGLFAAGATGQGGMLLLGHGHHLGWAFTSGRMAGRNVLSN
jgi:succinate dehydrogenase/fumarate reductase flavoprotein subunit